jgi:hypothetical protein
VTGAVDAALAATIVTLIRRLIETDLLLRYAPSGDRAVGVAEDTENRGWRTHLDLQQEPRRRARVVDVGE